MGAGLVTPMVIQSKRGLNMKPQTTTKSQHTPGPWKIHSRPGNITIVSEVDRDELNIHYESICQIPQTWATPREANARLIAAAPEQNDALHLAEDTLSKASDALESAGMEDARGLVRSTLIAVREAIARAEGGK